jgi:1,4-alpha-glucan branching enzyme
MKMPFVEQLEESGLYRITFRYKNPRVNEVNLVSSLDNWSIYSHPMTRDSDGYWTYQITVKRGSIYYYFFADGKKMIDVENPDRIFLDLPGEVSEINLQ